MPSMDTIWLIATVAFAVLEAATSTLVSIWFVLGALAALVAASLGAEIWLQLLLFVVVSAVALVLTRPLAKKMLDKKKVPTNADRLLHDIVRVTEDIDNINSKGAVYADGKTWSARSEDGDYIKAGSMVQILRIEGVKVYVINIPDAGNDEQ